jgi:hypothetical protein
MIKLKTKKSILTLAAAVSLVCGYGQVYPTVTWAKDQGASGTEVTYGVTTDASGNVYTTGLFLGTMDLDPGPGTMTVTSLGQQDVFITKLDANGNFVWGKTVGGTQGDVPANITVDASNNVIVCGNFAGIADFDPGAGTFSLTSAGASDGFVVKLDANGNFVWAAGIGSTLNEFVYGVSTDAAGNVYAAGLFTGTTDFDPGPGVSNMTSAGGDDGFVVKYTPAGALAWAKQLGTTGADAFNAIDVRSNGFVSVAGYFSGTLPAGFFSGTSAAAPSQGLKDGIMWTLTTAGVSSNGAIVGSATEEQFTTIAVDDANNALYAAGFYSGPVGAPWNLTNSGSTDAFLIRFGLSGNVVSSIKYSHGIGNAQAQSAKSLDVDVSGNVYIGGIMNGTGIVDFDPSPFTNFVTGAGLDDQFLASYDSTGVTRFAFNIGNANTDFAANSIGVKNTNIHVGGGYTGIVDFDPGAGTSTMTPVASYDGYVVKYNFCVAPAMPTASTPTVNLTNCSGQSATISATGVPSGTISWYTASIGGTYLGSGSPFTTQTLSTTTTFYAQDSTCTASNNRVAITVTVVPSPTVAISSFPTPPVACAGNTIVVVAFGASTYSWTNGVVNNVPFVPGNTTYSVTGTAANGCKGTAAISVTVNPSPTVAANSGTICSGNSFTIVPSGASTYTIQGGSSVVSPTTNTSYTVIGTSTNGCTGTATSNIVVNTIPTVAVVSSASLICVGQTANLTASGATSYVWNTSATTASIAVSPSVTTTYTVTGTGANGCTKAISITQNVSACTSISNDASSLDVEINIYPNPSNGILNIELGTVENTSLIITNALGQIVLNEKVNKELFSLNLSNFSNGVYFIQVLNNNKTIKAQKIIKQ